MTTENLSTCRYNWSDPTLAVLTVPSFNTSQVLDYLGHDLRETILECSLSNSPVECSSILDTTYTDSGTFASLPEQ